MMTVFWVSYSFKYLWAHGRSCVERFTLELLIPFGENEQDYLGTPLLHPHVFRLSHNQKNCSLNIWNCERNAFLWRKQATWFRMIRWWINHDRSDILGELTLHSVLKFSEYWPKKATHKLYTYFIRHLCHRSHADIFLCYEIRVLCTVNHWREISGKADETHCWNTALQEITCILYSNILSQEHTQLRVSKYLFLLLNIADSEVTKALWTWILFLYNV